MHGARRASERTSATTVEIDGREVVAFAGCNYLGLAHHPRVLEALRSGLDDFGVSAGASRQTTGTSCEHEELEDELARFLRTESALLAPDGYLANTLALQGLRPRVDRVLLDAQAHVSLRDAIAAAGTPVEEYAHVDVRSLERLVRSHAHDAVAVCTDGVFPSSGEIAPLRGILALLPANATLLVDDCHALGVLGERGRGTCEHESIVDARVVITGTLSKSLGCHGGFVAGSRSLIDAVRAHSRAYAGSTPIPPALARAARAALSELASDPGRLERLRRNIERLRAHCAALAIAVPAAPLPVFALTLGSGEEMERIEDELLRAGFLVPCVSYPDRPDRYLRLTVSAGHSIEDVDLLADALAAALGRAREARGDRAGERARAPRATRDDRGA